MLQHNKKGFGSEENMEEDPVSVPVNESNLEGKPKPTEEINASKPEGGSLFVDNLSRYVHVVYCARNLINPRCSGM